MIAWLKSSALLIVALLVVLAWAVAENYLRRDAQADLANAGRRIKNLTDDIDRIVADHDQAMRIVTDKIRNDETRRSAVAAQQKRIVPNETPAPAVIRSALDGLRDLGAGNPNRNAQHP